MGSPAQGRSNPATLPRTPPARDIPTDHLVRAGTVFTSAVRSSRALEQRVRQTSNCFLSHYSSELKRI